MRKPKVGAPFLIRKIKRKQPFMQAQTVQPKILMCRPSHYKIAYSINPWMNLNNQALSQKALEQWDNLHDRLVEHGVEVILVKPQKDLPDMVFTANAGLVFPKANKVVLSNFKHDERKNEEQWFLEWFLERGFSVDYPSLPFEGAGDALVLGETLVGGYGFRSEKKAYDKIAELWDGPTLLVELIFPLFYHLDTCFCPLVDNDFLVYSGAIASVDLSPFGGMGNPLYRIGNPIEVPPEEAALFACNAICVGRKVFLPAGCPQTEAMLRERQYEPISIEMSEFRKAGGACKCLTLSVS